MKKMWYRAFFTSILAHIIGLAMIFGISPKTQKPIEFVSIDFTKVVVSSETNKSSGNIKEVKRVGNGGPKEIKKEIERNDPQGYKFQGQGNTHELSLKSDEISLNPIIDRDYKEKDNPKNQGDGAGSGGYGHSSAHTGSGLLTSGMGGGAGGGTSKYGGGYGYGGADITDYGYVREAIMKNIVYPEKARRMGWEGRVILSFIINEKGFINDVKVLKSSGYTLLDEAAKEAVFKINQLKKRQERMMVQLPVEFRLK